MTRRGVAAAGVVLLLASPLGAQDPASGRAAAIERPIVTVGKGPQKLRVDLPLLIAGQRFVLTTIDNDVQVRDGLGDLRLVDRSSREIGYLLINPPPRRASWLPGTILPVAATKKTSGFEVDLGRAHLVDGLDVQGLPPPFMKRLALEGSGDRARWTVLIGEGTVFDLPDDRVRQTVLAFTPGSYRYLRVTWDDANSARLPMPQQVRARTAVSRSRPAPDRVPVSFERQASEPGRSRYRVQLPAAGLPIVALLLDAGTGDVFRTAIALESRFSGVRADPMELGRARLVQTARAAGTPSSLRLPIQAPLGSEVQLTVEDGDNAPLDLTGVSIELAELPWIYFEALDAGPVAARYGSRGLETPQYDLEAKRSTIDLAAVPEASWGEPASAAPTSVPPPSPPPTVERGAQLNIDHYRHRRGLAESARGLVTLQLDAAALAHSRGPHAAFADVRIVDRERAQIPYLLERRDEPLSIDLTVQPTTAKIPSLAEPARGARSVYAIALPYGQLPSPRLVLETSARVFRRPVQVGIERPADRRHRDAWFDVLSTTVWQHADQGRPAPSLDVAIAPGEGTRLLIAVDEGDNQPLTIASARLLLPSWRLRFFRPEGPLQLVYGNADAHAPQYDLALLAPAVMGAEAKPITAAVETPGESAPPTILSPRVFWIGLGAAVLVLLGLIVRLMRGERQDADGRGRNADEGGEQDADGRGRNADKSKD
jgi:hypothetical protein